MKLWVCNYVCIKIKKIFPKEEQNKISIPKSTKSSVQEGNSFWQSPTVKSKKTIVRMVEILYMSVKLQIKLHFEAK